MFCRNCGKEINEADAFCPHCGAANAAEGKGPSGTDTQQQQAYQQPYGQPYQQPPYQQPYGQPYQQPYANQPEDSGSAGWGVLGFFFPIVGLILFIVWKSTKPRSAKNAGIGALISVIIGFVFGIILGVIMIQVMDNAGDYYYYVTQIAASLL